MSIPRQWWSKGLDLALLSSSESFPSAVQSPSPSVPCLITYAGNTNTCLLFPSRAFFFKHEPFLLQALIQQNTGPRHNNQLLFIKLNDWWQTISIYFGKCSSLGMRLDRILHPHTLQWWPITPSPCELWHFSGSVHSQKWSLTRRNDGLKCQKKTFFNV